MVGGAPAAGAPDLTPLLTPRSVAVVGANDRPGSYGDAVLRNLAAAGFEGQVWAVNPKREEVHGRPCVASVADLPEPVDAVVVVIPAAAVTAVIAEAGERSCGGAVVIAAGFGESPAGAPLEADLRAAAAASGLPVLGPNCNGIVATAARASLWGDSLERVRPGSVALITQSGNVGVNALGAERGIGFHTVVSIGNGAVLDASDWLAAVAGLDGVGSIALFLESDGDGAKLARALARCAERDIGVAVLKVGSSAAGARAAGAHTGALAGDQRIFAALLEEAGAARASDPAELLELARALAQPAARPRGGGGLAILTCSGGDSGIAADLAAERGLDLPELAPPTRERLRGLLPDAATVANPLDYTSLLWDEPAVLEEVAEAVGADPGIDQLLLLFDQPSGLAPDVREGWDAVRRALLAGARRSGAAVLLGSTLPELLEPEAAAELAGEGIACAAGLSEAIACAAALRTPFADPARLEEIAAAAEAIRDSVSATGAPAPSPAPGVRSYPRYGRIGANADAGPGAAGGGDSLGEAAAVTRPLGDGWLGEAEAKRLLADGGLAVPAARVAVDAAGAVEAARDIGWPVVLKLTSPALLHKSEAGALALDLRDEDELHEAAARLLALPAAAGATLLVERMAAAGVELLLAARGDGVVPALVLGLGGIWAEALDDTAVVPLPAPPARVERALRSLRAAPLLLGARGGPAPDLAAAARFGSRLGELLLEHRLDLLEVNPALLTDHNCIALDALARHPQSQPT